jgi:hypothetical protein
VLFPQPRRQFGNSRCGVLPDAVQSTSGDQTLDDADVPGAKFSPTERPAPKLRERA